MKRIVKLIVKKILGESLFQRLKRAVEILLFRPVFFEGVYKNFAEIKDSTPYNAGNYLAKSFEYAKKKYQLAVDNLSYIPPAFKDSGLRNILPLLAASLRTEKQKVHILDFGGGLGASYIDLLGQLKGLEVVYHIVDLEENRKEIQSDSSYTKSDNFNFHTSVENIAHLLFDIIYLGSSLQYIENYVALISRLAEMKPRYIFLSHTLVVDGTIETFATVQVNVQGKRLKNWIFNYGEIEERFKAQGYGLIYRSANYDEYLNLDNYNEQFRKYRSANLLFLRLERTFHESL
ncbi:MAG: methyltransferase, TIGR04325 family [Candidatus Omnitrophica bacterium]|nr:methyltransferase, TIGR04325 family [Candidatus Omnitrophota bacterium]